MRNLIGVMQGRLLPKYQRRYQAHPVGYWQDEFVLASDNGLDCIEFILDYNEAKKNPLLTDNGVDEICATVNKTGVQVKTVCADYFMEAPLHSGKMPDVDAGISVLMVLLENGKRIGITDIVMPCVDQSSLDSNEKMQNFLSIVTSIKGEFEKSGINLSLETDLPPGKFADLLARIDSNNVSINYDIGNSASLGFNPVEELTTYGEKISDIHIKDRVLGGGSVLLGTGDANFDGFFKKLSEFDYAGPFIMQAYRDDEGVSIFKKQLEWVKKYINL